LGLVNKVTQVISNTNNVNISSMSFDSNDGTFEGNILLKVKNTALLKKMIKQLQNINGVDKVIRE
jgi:GTP pyrophosphokinase